MRSGRESAPFLYVFASAHLYYAPLLFSFGKYQNEYNYVRESISVSLGYSPMTIKIPSVFYFTYIIS